MEDLKEIKSDVKELLQRSAVHNELLRTHEARSLALQSNQEKLESRVEPIEKHVHTINVGLKILGLVALPFLVNALVSWLLK